MKKLLTAAVVLCCLLQVQAQDIRFGFQLSPTIGWMSTNENLINSNGANLGLKLGMTGDFYFRENYAISSGIGFYFNSGGTLFYEENFDTVGIWSEVDIPGSDGVYNGGTNFKYSIQLVEIPLGLKLRTREFGYIRYFLQPEVTFGFRTQARGSIENVTGIDAEEKYDIKSAVNLLNLSWGIGGGVEYNISESTSLVGGLAFQAGFADMTKDNRTVLSRGDRMGTSEDNSRGKLYGLIIRLGVIF